MRRVVENLVKRPSRRSRECESSVSPVAVRARARYMGAMPGAEWIAQVETACAGRGLQMTALRREVVGIFAQAGQPLGAYTIIQKLAEAQKRIVAPPTVYRTLDFLVDNGFVVKIESRQVYAPCGHVDHAHDHHGIVFSCTKCGSATEVDSAVVDEGIASLAERLHFKVERKVQEIDGVCTACRPVD